MEEIKEEIEEEIGVKKSGKHTGFNRGFLVVSSKKDFMDSKSKFA